MPKKRWFFVACKNNRGVATYVDESEDSMTSAERKMSIRELRRFYRDYAGYDIRHVDGDEMKRLMTID